MRKGLIIGSGLAGLTCAKVLIDHGIRDFYLLEKTEKPGGRVCTDRVEGFYLDRGFQVLFTAYPMVQKHLDLQQLEVRAYRPGAVLVKAGRSFCIGDPFRDLASLGSSLTNPLLPFIDKLRILQLRFRLWQTDAQAILQEPDLSTEKFVQQFGFSQSTFQHFLQPFYRGILLDPNLETSARLFKFYFKMLSEGEIVTPRLGMGQISEQLARILDPGQIRYHHPVKKILIGDQSIPGSLGGSSDESVQGVELQNGEILKADWIVCAVDLPALRELFPQGSQYLPTSLPDGSWSVVCLYFAGVVSLTKGAYIHLNATGQGWINSCVQLTQVSPDLAPEGQHLYSVVSLGNPAMSDEDLIHACHQELQQWFPGYSPEYLTKNLRCLCLYRIPFAQFAQPPGIQDYLPDGSTPIQNLIYAGEYTHQSSIEGAMRSGESAAYRVLDLLRIPYQSS
jgi:phytoene dehydrogenase-like protein